jgi:hypothetical protein
MQNFSKRFCLQVNADPGKWFLIISALLFIAGVSCSTLKPTGTRMLQAGMGWANNSVNTVSFRKNSLFTAGDTQFIAFYDPERYMVLGKRLVGDTVWRMHRTKYQGNAADAHNSISIVVDKEGYLHAAWDHHNNALRYARSVAPYSLELGEKMPMTGKAENRISYPEFYMLPDGKLLFFYRDGGSGNGNLVINQYNPEENKWVQLHNNLIDGEGKRNAYWQACTDDQGTLHVSWVWRESPDVASNHDLCYARSKDGGLTWEKSNGEKYTLPITATTAEYALRIPQKHELINQTSMTTDDEGRPFIASYWRDSSTRVPTYHVVYWDKTWKVSNVGLRQTPFSLSGAGSKRIPIARPQILVRGSGEEASVWVVFRDEERGSKVSIAATNRIQSGKWKAFDLTDFSVGSWEPTLDLVQWKKKNTLHLFVQHVEQVDSEGRADLPPQMVYVLEWNPNKNEKK